MFQHIILLTPQPQQHFALTALLKEYNPALSFTSVSHLQDLANIDRAILPEARLIAFTSGTIVPPETLESLGYGAYNFHPGSPAYPGWAPAHFALYERAAIFGATAHLMTERVDAGPIVGTETFVVPQGISVRELEQIAYVRLAYLFWRLAKQLATQPGPLAPLPIEWGHARSTRQMYVSMCDIPVDISKDEMQRRMQAFHDDFRGIHPTITLHGIEFRAVGESMTRSGAGPQALSINDTNAEVRRRA